MVFRTKVLELIIEVNMCMLLCAHSLELSYCSVLYMDNSSHLTRHVQSV